jgi:Skp family chaperone for outer membrane proteins
VSTGSDKEEQVSLQHAAEHEKPHKKLSVMTYLVILIAAAFLLLLLSYFMQQRANQEAIADLQQTSNSAVQSLDNLIAERDGLKRQNEELQTRLDELQSELNDAVRAAQENQEQQSAATEANLALMRLNQLRALYNQGRYREARALLEEWGEAGAASPVKRSMRCL